MFDNIILTKSTAPTADQLVAISEQITPIVTLDPTIKLNGGPMNDSILANVSSRYIIPENVNFITAVTDTERNNEYLLVSNKTSNQMYLIPALYSVPVNISVETNGYSIGANNNTNKVKSTKSYIQEYDDKGYVTSLVPSNISSVTVSPYAINDTEITSLEIIAPNFGLPRGTYSSTISVMDFVLTAPIDIFLWSLQSISPNKKTFIPVGVVNTTTFSIPLPS